MVFHNTYFGIKKFDLISNRFNFKDYFICVYVVIHPLCYLFLFFYIGILTNVDSVISVSLVAFRLFGQSLMNFLSMWMAPKMSVMNPESGEPMVAPSI